MLLRLDEIVNISPNFRTQVASHATKAEQNLGEQKDTSAPMDVKNVSKGERDEEGAEDVDEMGKNHEVFEPRDDGACRQRLQREG